MMRSLLGLISMVEVVSLYQIVRVSTLAAMIVFFFFALLEQFEHAPALTLAGSLCL